MNHGKYSMPRRKKKSVRSPSTKDPAERPHLSAQRSQTRFSLSEVHLPRMLSSQALSTPGIPRKCSGPHTDMALVLRRMRHRESAASPTLLLLVMVTEMPPRVKGDLCFPLDLIRPLLYLFE